MNKAELVKEVSKITGFAQKDVNAVITATNEATAKGLKNDGVVKDGLFTHRVKVTNPRTGRNPRTGEVLQIPSKKKVVTKHAKSLDEAVQ